MTRRYAQQHVGNSTPRAWGRVDDCSDAISPVVQIVPLTRRLKGKWSPDTTPIFSKGSVEDKQSTRPKSSFSSVFRGVWNYPQTAVATFTAANLCFVCSDRIEWTREVAASRLLSERTTILILM